MPINRSDFPVVTISATGTENHRPTILEFSRFLYQVHLSYEIARLATDPQYGDFRFPKYTFAPSRSRLRWQDQLELDAVRHESPWRLKSSLVAFGAVAPTLWLLAQTFDKIGNYQLNREMVRAEIHEIQTKTRSEQLSNIEKATQLGVQLTEEDAEIRSPQRQRHVLTPEEAAIVRSMLARRNADQFYERSQRILKGLPFRVGELDIRIVPPGESQNDKE
jgi:hypothetical protein